MDPFFNLLYDNPTSMSSSNIEIIIFRILQPITLAWLQPPNRFSQNRHEPGMAIIRCALPGTALG